MSDSPTDRRLVRDVVVVGAGDVFKGLRVLVVLPLLTRLVGPEGYGIWAQIKVSSLVLASVALLGMNGAMLRFLSGDRDPQSVREQFNSAFWTAIVAATLLVVAMSGFAAPVSSVLFGTAAPKIYVGVTALYFLLEAVDQLSMAYFRATRQMGFHTSLIALEVVGEVGVISALAISGHSLSGLVVGMVAWKGAVVAVKAGRGFYQVGISAPHVAVLRRYMPIGIPLVLASLAYLVVSYGDRYFLNFYLGIGAVGMYTAAAAIGSLPIVLCAPIDYVMYPAIAAHWNGGRHEDATRHIEMMLRWFVIVFMPVLAGLAVSSVAIMATVATAAFVPAAPVAFVLALASAVFGVGIVGERVMVLAGAARTVTVLYVALIAVNGALNVLLIPRVELMGAALATLATFVLYAGVTLSNAHRHCPFSLPTAIFWKGIMAGAAGAVAAFPIAGEGTWRLAGGMLVGGAVYGVSLVVLGAVRIDDLRIWLRPLRITS